VATVLIVEDDTEVRVLAGSIFREAGYTTLSAGTLTEAHAILHSETDMTLVDEQEAGLQIGQSAAQAGDGVPVIYTTGRGVTDGMIALFLEPHRFVPKPWTEQVLRAADDLLQPKSLASRSRNRAR
jgi:DNA-binding NtrC family response regulator